MGSRNVCAQERFSVGDLTPRLRAATSINFQGGRFFVCERLLSLNVAVAEFEVATVGS